MDNCCVGARCTDLGATDAGVAYLFDVTTGELLQRFDNPSPESGDQFAQHFAILGERILVGGKWENGNPGEAYMFDSETGELLHTFVNPTPAVGDQFGFVGHNGWGQCVDQCAGDDTGATDAGAAYLFDGTTGVLLQTILNPSPAAGDEFGRRVCDQWQSGRCVGVGFKDVGKPPMPEWHI